MFDGQSEKRQKRLIATCNRRGIALNTELNPLGSDRITLNDVPCAFFSSRDGTTLTHTRSAFGSPFPRIGGGVSGWATAL